MNGLVVALLIVLEWLQIQLFGGSGSRTEVNHLRQAIVEQQQSHTEWREMNTELGRHAFTHLQTAS